MNKNGWFDAPSALEDTDFHLLEAQFRHPGVDGSDDFETPRHQRRGSRAPRRLLVSALLAALVTGGWFAERALSRSTDNSESASQVDVAGANASTAKSGSSTTLLEPEVGPVLTFTDSRVTLSGAFRDETAHGSYASAVQSHFGAGVFADESSTSPLAPDLGDIASDPMVRCLGEEVFNGVGATGIGLRMDRASNKLMLEGLVSTAQAKDRLIGSAASVAGGLDRIVDRVSVADPAAVAPSGDPASTGDAPTGASANGPSGSEPPATASGSTGQTTGPTVAPSDTIQQSPTQSAIALQNGLDKILAGKVIEFKSGESVLTEAWVTTIDEVAVAMKDSTAHVQIAGHADDTGQDSANQLLSEQRSTVIRDALVARGIASDRLTTIGYGSSRPIADNSTEEGKQRNRRIEFVVTLG